MSKRLEHLQRVDKAITAVSEALYTVRMCYERYDGNNDIMEGIRLSCATDVLLLAATELETLTEEK